MALIPFYTLSVVILTNLILGFLVLSGDTKNKINIIFGLLALAVALWSLAIFGFFYFEWSIFPKMWVTLSHAFGALTAVIFIYFSLSFPAPLFKDGRKLFFLVLPFFIILYYLFYSNQIIGPVSRGTYKINSGYYFYALFIMSYFLASYIFLFLQRAKATELRQKKQLKYILASSVSSSVLATLVALIFPVFNVFQYIWLGPVFTLILVFSIVAAIWKHRLFNIRMIMAELLAFIIWIFTLVRFLLANTAPERLINGGFLGFVIIFGILLIRSVLKEVEQREKLETLSRQLFAANKELKKLDAAKSEFISIASHQLRAPLTIIKGYVSLVREGTLGKITSQSDQALERVAIATEQLVKLVNNLLDLSRMEAGKLKYEFTPTDFIKLAEEIVAEFKPEAAQKGLELELQNSAGPVPPFKLDAEKIREVVTNLVDNAIKYSSAGKVLVKIEGENYGGRLWLRLSVADTGIGIKKEDLDRLFIKFSRTPESQKIDPYGMGIGLYFVKKVVEDHGGKVWAESDGIGKGSIFFMELPVR